VPGRPRPHPDPAPARRQPGTHDRRQIVQQVGVGQSTVSHHLKVLAQVRFVTAEYAGTSSRHQVNPRCLAAFPTAADAVMGRRLAK
jgi:DNA-binding transcriptional ArsR family regulator